MKARITIDFDYDASAVDLDRLGERLFDFLAMDVDDLFPEIITMDDYDTEVRA